MQLGPAQWRIRNYTYKSLSGKHKISFSLQPQNTAVIFGPLKKIESTVGSFGFCPQYTRDLAPYWTTNASKDELSLYFRAAIYPHYPNGISLPFTCYKIMLIDLRPNNNIQPVAQVCYSMRRSLWTNMLSSQYMHKSLVLFKTRLLVFAWTTLLCIGRKNVCFEIGSRRCTTQ